MKLFIGETLKKLRRERDLTQEELASHIGISFQAISKWERGDGYPDITLLPTIARYFDISIDELIGIDKLASEEQYEAINREYEENRKKELRCENVTLMKNALKLYPNDPLLLVQLSCSLEKAKGTEAEKTANLRESIAVQEQILQFTEDSEIRNATLCNICYSYARIGEHEKALEYAKKLPNMWKTRENTLAHFLDGEEKYQNSKDAIAPLAYSLSLHLKVLAKAEKDTKYLEALKKLLYILLEIDGNEYIRTLYENAM
ncbi:MAG: helix-turn-helix transcriptional regulator [Clostridia bacterium]|nr:helix-turn-helix transcriptional regulator [Clostridia bacterium]MBP3554787.1 helix-turn-helix transcriptional regulator [Clostridia bacterium]